MAVVPSLSMLFVPTCTKTNPPLPESTMFSTLSVIASILAPGKQTTTSSPLFKTLSVFLTIESPTNTLALILTPSITFCPAAMSFSSRLLSGSLSLINLSPFPPVAWLTCAPVPFPPVSLTPITLTIVSFPPPTPSLLSPPLLFPSIHLSSLPFLSFSSPFILSLYVPSPYVPSPYDLSPYLFSASSRAEVSSPEHLSCHLPPLYHLLSQPTCSLPTTATMSSLSCSNSTSSSFILIHPLHSKLKLSA